jgi:hypothetical protein
LHLVLSKGGDKVRSSGTFKFKWGSAIALTPPIFFAATPHIVAAQAQGAPTDIAVFDFELEDGSAGAGIAGDRAADNGFIKAVSTEVRRVIAQSGAITLSILAAPMRMPFAITRSKRVMVATPELHRHWALSNP